MALNDSTQEVSLLSPRGHRELFLLTHLNYDHLTPSDQVLYQELAQHVARAKALESKNFPGPIDRLAAHGELASLADPPWAALQADVATLSQQLNQRVKNYHPKLFELLSDYGLHLIANYDLLRIHLLKFVAVLSALDFDGSGQEVKRLLTRIPTSPGSRSPTSQATKANRNPQTSASPPRGAMARRTFPAPPIAR